MAEAGAGEGASALKAVPAVDASLSPALAWETLTELTRTRLAEQAVR